MVGLFSPMWQLLFLIVAANAVQYSHNCLLFIPQYDQYGTAETIGELEARINVWLAAQNGSLHITSEGFINVDQESVINGELLSTWSVRTGHGESDAWVTRSRGRQLCFYNTSDIIIPDGNNIVPPPYPNPMAGADMIHPSLFLPLLGLSLLIQ